MYYTIYKITNKINGNFYIGKHISKIEFDRYFGSGKLILQAIRKYGRKQFKKEILHYCFDELEMNRMEREIVTEEFCRREDTYNLMVGGEGRPKGLSLSTEHIEKIRKSLINKPKTKAHNKKVSLSLIGRKLSEDHKLKLKLRKIGIKQSQEFINKRISPLRGRKLKCIECPKCHKMGRGNTMKRWHFENCGIIS